MSAWINRHSFPRFATRYNLHCHISDFVKNDPIDYLEFGVFLGVSMKWWLELNRRSESRFFGFDHWHGVPDAWGGLRGTGPGRADAGGVRPSFDDGRVHLIDGLFQETLKEWLGRFEPRSRLVVHLDADSFASTLFVLTQLDSLLAPDTIMIFDEFSLALDEWRAFSSWRDAYRRKCEPIGSAGPYHERLAVRVIS